MASNPNDYVIQQVRKKAYDNHDMGYEQFEPIEERIYVPVQREKWDKVFEEFDEIEERYGLDLDDERKFIKDLMNPDQLQGVDDEEITEDVSTGEKLLIKRQIRESSNDEIIGKTDETIGTKNLFKLHEEIYQDTGKKAFIISDQRSFEGRVSVELSKTKKKFSLMSVHADKDGNEEFRHFGQSNPGKGLNIVDEFSESFYQYKFIADDNEYLVLSREKLDTVRCILKGTHVSISDYKTVGENRKLPVNQEIIFAHSVEPAIEPFSPEELEELQEKIDREYFMQHHFGVYRHPEWFEDMFVATMTVGEEYDGYPAHWLIMAPPDTGKSTLLESTLIAYDEPKKEPFEGGGSTIKGLTPSFKSNPPDEGYLLQSQRISGVDEKLNLLKNTMDSNNQSARDAFRPMTSLLEHKKRNFSSGNGEITGQMEATMIATTNDAYGINNLIQAQQKLDTAYLSRFIQYEQLDSHIDFIDKQKNEIDVENYEDGLPDRNDEFISLMDTLRNVVNVEVDNERIGAIHEELKQKVPAGFQQTFRARHKHHIKCVVGGLAKIRYFSENRDGFEARNEDYERAKELFEILITSWGEVDASKFSSDAKKQALTHAQRRVYQVINDNPGIEGWRLADKTDVDRLSWCLTELKRNRLVAVVEDDDETQKYYPEWCEEFEEAMEMMDS